MTFITFNCEFCGTEKTERLCWHKKREHHFCSRVCANRFTSNKRSFGLTRPEYEKMYWAKPENAARRKILAKESYLIRMKEMGISFKRSMINRIKTRALKDGIPFDLSISDFDIPSHCPILGIKLEVGTGQGGKYNSPSLDRIIPSFGYVKGNVCVISNRANRIKWDATYSEIFKVAEWVKAMSRRSENKRDYVHSSSDNDIVL